MFYSIHRQRAKQPMPAVFLDRDGTINVEKSYLFRVKEWEWIPGSKEAIKQLKQAGYLVVVVSNQAGIARGKYRPEDVDRLHSFIQGELAQIEASIDAFYYCPHHPDFTGACACRKPETGMLQQAARDLNLDLARSWMIGDKLSDVQAGHDANIKSILVRTGYGIDEQKAGNIGSQSQIFDSFFHAVQFVTKMGREHCGLVHL